MYLVFPVILIACQVVILLLPLLCRTPLRINLTPLLALAVLWLNWLLFHDKSGLSAFRIILWILFAFISLQVLTPTTAAVFSFADRGKKAAPVLFGKTDRANAVIMVYHPGASKLPKEIGRASCRERV